MSKNKDFLFYRAYIIYFSFVLLMGLVLWMTISIQLSDKESIFSSEDDRIPKKTIVEEAEYGDILDKDLNPLVTKNYHQHLLYSLKANSYIMSRHVIYFDKQRFLHLEKIAY